MSNVFPGAPGMPRVQTTGRQLVLFATEATETATRTLAETVGLKVTSIPPAETAAVDPDSIAASEAMVFESIGVAVVNSAPDQAPVLGTAATAANGILAIEPERVVYAIGARSDLPPYLRGYRDGVNQLVDKLLADGEVPYEVDEEEPELSEEELTWGLQVTGVPTSTFTGQGVRIAVLDTGLDLNHPDFAGRTIIAQSFIMGEEVQDENGHGTHVIGTACGPLQPAQLPRYGIAYNSEIFAGKVLSNSGSGFDGGILAGINWAIANDCPIISMSLGAPANPDGSFSQVYETVARRALALGTLIIAAAGNESDRPDFIAPVGHPANCPSIMAVGALSRELDIAFFSSGGLNFQGGQVDIAGPGVAVRSSWPGPTLYNTISGTSMATPHVAGIAALYLEANPDMRGGPLGWLLLQGARRLDLPSRDAGAGLVQVPQIIGVG